jgi:hypothetical protein
LDPPVVDLLPFPLGIFVTAQRINDNGDIVGRYQVAIPKKSEIPQRSVWHFNPGLYGHPEFRLAREVDSDGFALPVDLTHADHTVLFEEIGSLNYTTIEINEPDFEAGRPAQIIAIPGAAVRHTISDPIVDPNQTVSPFTEILPELSYTYRVGGINADGTFAARSAIYTGKGTKTNVCNHIYSSGPTTLPVDPYVDAPAGINDNGQVVHVNGALFGNWNDGHGDRVVQLEELVIGSEADLLKWNSFPIKEYESVSGQGLITGRLRSEDYTTAKIFVLTEEPVTQ